MRVQVDIHVRMSFTNANAEGSGGYECEQDFEYINRYRDISSIKFVDKEKRKQKGGNEYKTEHKTRSARNTGRKTGREESTHTRHRLIDTGKQTRNVREGDQGYYW